VDMINEASSDKSGVITFYDFVRVMHKIKLGQSTAFGDVYKVVKERLSHFEAKIKQAKIEAKKNDPTKIKFNSKISKFETFQGGESSSKPGPKPSGKLNTSVPNTPPFPHPSTCDLIPSTFCVSSQAFEQPAQPTSAGNVSKIKSQFN